LFFRLPYHHDDIFELEKEVLGYAGFKADSDMMQTCVRRGLPASILVLLQGLLDKNPSKRPTCAAVVGAMKSGKFDPVTNGSSTGPGRGGPLPVIRRYPDPKKRTSPPLPSHHLPGIKRQASQSPDSPPKSPTPTARPSTPVENLCAVLMESLATRRLQAPRFDSHLASEVANELIECELEEEALILALMRTRDRRMQLEEVRDTNTPTGGYLAITGESNLS